MKKIFILALFIIISLNPVFSYGYKTHNDQMLNTIYGFSDGWNTMKGYDNVTKLRYYAISDAAYVAIDYNGVTNSNKLKAIGNNLKKLGVESEPIDIANYPSLGMGTHRAYNHQGFDYDYIREGAANAAKKQARWATGKQLMISTAKKAYNLTDVQANVLAREQYYIHMLGDLQKGSTKSIKAMGKIGEIGGLIDDYDLSLRSYAIEISATNPSQSKQILKQAKKLSNIKKQYSKYTGITDKSRMAAKTLQENELKGWTKETNEVLDIPTTAIENKKFRISKSLGGNMGAAAIGTGVYTLYRAFTGGGFSNISLSEIAYVGGISAAGAVTDTMIEIGVPKLANALSLGSKATGAIFLVANALVDTAFDSWGYMSAYNNGIMTGQQAARNIGISVGKNALSGGLSFGINTGLAIALTNIIPGGAIFVIGSGLSLGAYHIINYWSEQIIQYYNLRDIVVSVENGSADYAGWVDQYFGK